MLEHLSELKPDPILSLMVEFQNDPRPEKVDLGIGVYKNEFGQTPMMAAVKHAQIDIANQRRRNPMWRVLQVIQNLMRLPFNWS